MKWHFQDIWTESWVISGCYIDISGSGLGKDGLRGFQNKKHLMATDNRNVEGTGDNAEQAEHEAGNPFLRTLALKVWRNNQKSLQRHKRYKENQMCLLHWDQDQRNESWSSGVDRSKWQNKKANVTRTFLVSHVPHPFHREPSHFTSMHCSLNKYVGF